MISKQKNTQNTCYIIAEAGVNHNGSIEMAKQLVDVAAGAGADAVKFQTFKAEKVISKYAPKADYQKKMTSESESQLDMVKKLELDENAHRILIEYCRSRNIEFLSTPFDIESIDLLAYKLDLPRIKIPSGEITNGPHLLHVAKTGKPVILSTGMSTISEVETALGVLAFGYLANNNKPSLKKFRDAYCSETGRQALEEKVTLLHCTTEYPVPFEDVNLRVMDTMRNAFGLPVGYSDHTTGIAISLAAAARGAVIIEKHFTLDKTLPGPDHKASLEPQEFSAMVKGIRALELALGDPRKVPALSEIKNIAIARKSLTAACHINKGDQFSELNLTIKRPGNGISPMFFWDLLKKTADREYREDDTII